MVPMKFALSYSPWTSNNAPGPFSNMKVNESYKYTCSFIAVYRLLSLIFCSIDLWSVKLSHASLYTWPGAAGDRGCRHCAQGSGAAQSPTTAQFATSFCISFRVHRSQTCFRVLVTVSVLYAWSGRQVWPLGRLAANQSSQILYSRLYTSPASPAVSSPLSRPIGCL